VNSSLQRDPGSFRDTSGYVFSDGVRVFRTLSRAAQHEYDAALDCGLLDEATQQGLLIGSREVPVADLPMNVRGARGEIATRMLEHPRVPVISYPYEWTFSQLRDAALRHLELQLLALRHDFELSDATAYNMQFDAGDALHIDVLSLRRYRPGRPWEGYNQFCRQFLFPLLIESSLGIPFQRIYRGNLAGINVLDLKALVPSWKRFTSLNMLLHVQLQSSAVRSASSNNLSDGAVKIPEIPKNRYVAILEGLRDWILDLKSGRTKKTYWADYASVNTYSDQEKQEKQGFVRKTMCEWGSRSVLDLGGNSGDYSEAALAGGASRAYCIDGDVDALEIAYARRKAGAMGLLPLVIDWSDPSPGQGWAGKERQPLATRLQVDTVLALAVIHHIVIGGNVPMREFIDQLFAFGKTVIVEFVPKSDPMVQGLLRGRSDIFEDYTEDHLACLLKSRAEIQQIHRLRQGGRVLFACRSNEAAA
jgi:ribosomal protein L11 methylase PrmA